MRTLFNIYFEPDNLHAKHEALYRIQEKTITLHGIQAHIPDYLY
ncbi:MAG: hypothetical protein RIG77_17015 [Cyclobacteriaceae bacterium]